MATNLSLCSILDKENQLVCSNYLEWYRKLKIVLRSERKLYILTNPEPELPDEGASAEDIAAYDKYQSDAIDVQCLMLSSMAPDQQKQNEHLPARDMDLHLRELFQESARAERFETSRALFSCKMQEGSPVATHVLKMIGYIERLENLGCAMDNALYTDLILTSLPESFGGFVVNYNMNHLDKTLTDLLAMLRVAEKDL